MYLKLENYVRHWRGKRVLVIGDAMLDVDMKVDSERPSPEYPNSRVFKISTGLPAAGGAANAAVNLKAMGAEPHLVAVVGADANAHNLGACLADAGVEHSLVDDFRRPTTTKTRLGRMRMDCESTRLLSSRVARHVEQAIADNAPGSRAILLSDYGKGVLCPSVKAVLAKVDLRIPCPVVLDPKHTLHKQLADVVTHVTPNLSELRAMTGTWFGPLAKRMLERALGGADVVLTRGSDGAKVGATAVRTEPVKEPDVRGAGDTFVAAFTLALTAGADTLAATMLGNAAARQAVLRKGTAVVTAADVLLQLPQVAMRNQGLLRLP